MNSNETTALKPDLPTGLILAGMGGPDRLADIRPFLRNLFRDPAILPLPRPIASPLAAVIAAFRARAVAGKYKALWSDLKNSDQPDSQLGWTKLQAARLEKLLRDAGLNITATVAMRYWHPFSDEAVRELLACGVSQFVLVPTYPQYSQATSGSLFDELHRALTRLAPQAPVARLVDWHLLPGYLDTLASNVESVLRDWRDAGRQPAACGLLFVAHGLPERFIRAGDPYLKQTLGTLAASHALLASRLTDHRDWWRELRGGKSPLLAFQSRLGPVRWIGPDVTAEVGRLAAEGCKYLMVQPVSFTCEHIETLHELDVELAAHAHSCGVTEFNRGPALNLDRQWLSSLAAHIAAEIFGVAIGKFGVAAAKIEDIADGR